MNLARPRLSAFITARAFLTLAVGIAAAPKVALAGCSHDATPKAQHSVRSSLWDFKILAEHPKFGVAAIPDELKECPCRGPVCSQSPTHHDAPTVTRSTSLDPWCDTATATCIAGPGHNHADVDHFGWRPMIIASGLERPRAPGFRVSCCQTFQ